MKTILFALMLAALACGCDSSPTDKSGRLVAEESQLEANAFVIKDCGAMYNFKYMVIDEHEYLVSTHDRGIGIAHSPKCHCQRKY